MIVMFAAAVVAASIFVALLIWLLVVGGRCRWRTVVLLCLGIGTAWLATIYLGMSAALQ